MNVCKIQWAMCKIQWMWATFNEQWDWRFSLFLFFFLCSSSFLFFFFRFFFLIVEKESNESQSFPISSFLSLFFIFFSFSFLSFLSFLIAALGKREQWDSVFPYLFFSSFVLHLFFSFLIFFHFMSFLSFFVLFGLVSFWRTLQVRPLTILFSLLALLLFSSFFVCLFWPFCRSPFRSKVKNCPARSIFRQFTCPRSRTIFKLLCTWEIIFTQVRPLTIPRSRAKYFQRRYK